MLIVPTVGDRIAVTKTFVTICAKIAMFTGAMLMGAMITGAMLAGTAKAQSTPVELVRSLTSRTIAVLSDDNLTAEEKTARLHPVFKSYLDLPFIARFSLGRQWRTLSEAQKDRYYLAFESYVVGLYSKRLQTYSGERIEVLGDNTIDDRDTKVTSLILRDNGPPVSVGWRVRTAGGNARIIDVTIEGVSMAITQREDFAAELRRSSFEGLIRRLENAY